MAIYQKIYLVVHPMLSPKISFSAVRREFNLASKLGPLARHWLVNPRAPRGSPSSKPGRHAGQPYNGNFFQVLVLASSHLA